MDSIHEMAEPTPGGPVPAPAAAPSGPHQRSRFLRRGSVLGQGLAEYALILALIAIIAIIALIFLGEQISSILARTGESI
jgi:Flp pilus assembly pilin Flp